MMYSQDSYGLGHLRRATTLANALVGQRADLSVLLVVDSPVAPFFELRDHIDFVKLPTVVKVEAGVFRLGRLQTGYAQVRVMRSNLIREVLRRFRPHVLLVDHMPGGANRELVAALRLCRVLEYPTKLVLGLRDIIDDPVVTCATWQREGFYDTLRRFYDRVLIYGSPHIFPTAERYRIRDDGCESVQYCGYVCNLDPVKDPQLVRAKLDLADEPLVTVMAGGGADAHPLMQTYMDALPFVRAAIPVATVMVTGPFMPEVERKALRDQARILGVQIHSSVGDSLSHMNAADVVVSMAGYNTLAEILRLQKPAVVVPRPGPSAEQRMRARLFAERGLVSLLDPSELTPERLARAIVDALASPRPEPATLPALCGVAEATRALFDLLPPEATWDRMAPLKQPPRLRSVPASSPTAIRRLAGLEVLDDGEREERVARVACEVVVVGAHPVEEPAAVKEVETDGHEPAVEHEPRQVAPPARPRASSTRGMKE